MREKEMDREWRWFGEKTTILCNDCKHKRCGICCDAFPEGIPNEILRSGEHFHPFPDDRGIRFEPKVV